jgi:Immunoglobulin domain/Beta-propeller repeat
MARFAPYLLFALLIFSSPSLKAQGFVWTDQIGLTASPLGNKIAVDGAGNVYVTGGFQGTSHFGNTNLLCGGSNDVFLAKYDSSGHLLWVNQSKGTNSTQNIGQDVCTDTNGNVYIAGSFQGKVAFENTRLTASGSLSSGILNNLFLAKYNPSGNLIWVIQSGGYGGGTAFGIAVDNSGYVYSTGANKDFGGAEAITFDKWNASSGSLVWHKEYTQPPNYFFPMRGLSIKADASGNVYATGEFGGSVAFGTNTLATVNNFGGATFILKLNSSGNVLWAQQPGRSSSTTFDMGNSIALDNVGNVYIAGDFAQTNYFGTNLLTSAANFIIDGFVVKCDMDGNYLWAAQNQANGSLSQGVAADSFGNCYVVGSQSPSQVYLDKYDTNGNLVWALTPVHSANSGAYGVALDLSNKVYMTTWTKSNIVFDSFSFTNIGGNDLFVSQVYEQIPPSFVLQPKNSPPGFLTGETNTFTISTRSLYPVSYQWQFWGTNIDGATNLSLTITNAQLANAGPYQVVASNIYGFSTSAVANLTIYYAVNIIKDGTGNVAVSPEGASAQPGNFLSYPYNSFVTLTAVTNPPFAFVGWTGDSVDMNNPKTFLVTSNLYIVASFSDAITNIIIDNNDRRATFSSGWNLSGFSSFNTGRYGSNYAAAVCAASPTATATFRPNIVVPGYYDISIWYPSISSPYSFSASSPWTVYFDSGISLTNVNEQNNGGAWRLIATSKYFSAGTNGFVTLANSTGEAASKVVIANAVRFYPTQPPIVSTNPLSQVIRAGTNLTLKVSVSGSPPITYNWMFNGTNILSLTNTSTTSSLIINGVKIANAGSYYVAIGNVIGSVLSSNAVIGVLPPLQPVFGPPLFNQGGRVQLNLTGDSGVTFSILTSTNLSDWTVLTNILNSTGTIQFIDDASSISNDAARFYRAQWLSQ